MIVGAKRRGARGQGRHHDDSNRIQDRQDPVKDGLVASLNRPGGNITGVSFFTDAGGEAAGTAAPTSPQGTTIAMLVTGTYLKRGGASDVEAAAQAIGQQLIVLKSSSEREIEAAFASIVERGADAYWSAATRSSTRGGTDSSRWRRATRCHDLSSCANLSRPAA